MTESGDGLFSLRDKTILVTGGTRGIGLAISLRFARSGARVISNYLRDEKSAKQLEAIAADEGLHIALCRADLTTEKGLEQVASSLQEGRANLSGLVHCAATGIHRPIEELTERHFAEGAMVKKGDALFELDPRPYEAILNQAKAKVAQDQAACVVAHVT